MGEIVSVSRRTDVPAFHWEWFITSLDKGTVSVKNPFSNLSYTVSLSPDHVDCFVFWTKNPAPAFRGIETLHGKGFSMVFHITVNGYGSHLEKNVPPWQVAAKNVAELSKMVGRDKVFWRFDPLFPSEDPEATMKRFTRIADFVSPHVARCYVSTIHPYRKVIRRLRREGFPELKEQKKETLGNLRNAGGKYGLKMVSCSSEALEKAGFEMGACIDGEYLSKIFGNNRMKKNINPTRSGCGCTDSRDIGTYRSCGHHCLYCYAS